MKDEYLITNKIGAFSSSTYHSSNTRKYHGLLVVSDSNLFRKVIVNRISEVLLFEDGREVELVKFLYKDSKIENNISKYVKSFYSYPYFHLKYGIGEDIIIEKSILLSDFENSVKVRYLVHNRGESSFKLSVAPFLTNRNFHSLGCFADDFRFQRNEYPSDFVYVRLSEDETLRILPKNFTNTQEQMVFHDFFYPVEQRRGYDCYEDLVLFDSYTLDVGAEGIQEGSIEFLYSSGGEDQGVGNFIEESSSILSIQKRHYSNIVNSKFNELSDFFEFLHLRSKDFLIERDSRTSIIAGYHWFEDWGRDTFISFRGILLVRGEFELARKMLLAWQNYVKYGLVPNRPGLDEYNSLDATLWYIISIYYYYKQTNDINLVEHLFPTIENMISKLENGTRYEISVDSRGFLITKDKNKALTWMDAVINGIPVTPRVSAAVEIQMLWYNALIIFKEFSNILGEVVDGIEEKIERLKNNFNHFYWLNENNYLADYLDGSIIDKKIRPNPVIGLSLPFSILDREREEAVLDQIRANLVTKVGLKTLNNEDNEYKGVYFGSQEDRDFAYHNGTVWPWLHGLYLKSHLRVHGYSREAKIYVKKELLTFWCALQEHGLSYIPEIYSADNLEPRGCLSQAWSYATFLEVFEDLEKDN